MSDSKVKSSCRIKEGTKYPGKEEYINKYQGWIKLSLSGAARKVLTQELPRIRRQPNGALHPGDLKYERENQVEDEHERIMRAIQARRKTGLDEELSTMSTFSVMPDSAKKGTPAPKMKTPGSTLVSESKSPTVAPKFEPQEFEELEGKTSKEMLQELRQMMIKKKELGGNAVKAEDNVEALAESFDDDKDGDYITSKVRSEDGIYEDSDEGRQLKTRDLKLVAAMKKAQRKTKRWRDAIAQLQEEYDLLKVELDIRREAEKKHQEEYEQAQDRRLKEHQERYKDVPQVQGEEADIFQTPAGKGRGAGAAQQQPGGSTPTYQMPDEELSAKEAAYGESYINTLVNGDLPDSVFWRLSAKAYWDVKMRIATDFFRDAEPFYKEHFGSLWDRFQPSQGRELFTMIEDTHFRDEPVRADKEAEKYRTMPWDSNEKGYCTISEAMTAKAKQSNFHLMFCPSGEPLHSEDNIRKFFKTKAPWRLQRVIEDALDWEEENGLLPIASIDPKVDTWIRRLTRFQIRRERRNPPDPNFMPPAEGMKRIREMVDNGTRMIFKDVPIKNKSKSTASASAASGVVVDTSKPEGKCTFHVGMDHKLKDCNWYKTGATTFPKGWGPEGRTKKGGQGGSGKGNQGGRGKGGQGGQAKGGNTQNNNKQGEYGPKKVSEGYDVKLWCSADECRFVRRMELGGFQCFRCGVPLPKVDSWKTHTCKSEADVKKWMEPLRKAVLADKSPKAYAHEHNLYANAGTQQQQVASSSAPAEAKEGGDESKEANTADQFRQDLKAMIRQEIKDSAKTSGIDRYNAGTAVDNETKVDSIRKLMRAITPVSPSPPPHTPDTHLISTPLTSPPTTPPPTRGEEGAGFLSTPFQGGGG